MIFLLVLAHSFAFQVFNLCCLYGNVLRVKFLFKTPGECFVLRAVLKRFSLGGKERWVARTWVRILAQLTRVKSVLTCLCARQFCPFFNRILLGNFVLVSSH